MVFGGPNVGKGGMISLSSLTGSNGFKVDGENNGDYSGAILATAGDINGDGYADLFLGVDDHANYTGRSYVVFGGQNVVRWDDRTFQPRRL